MRTATRLALAIAALAAVGCGGGSSSSSDDCDKACSKLVACANALGTSVATLLDEPGVTPANCATGCRDQMKTCANDAAFFACTNALTCPAPGPSAVSDVQDALVTCAGKCM